MDKLPYFRFWEKDLVKGFHYYFPDAIVDIWPLTNEDTSIVTNYTAVLHNLPAQGTSDGLSVRMVRPDCIKSFQRQLVFSNQLSELVSLFSSTEQYAKQL